MSNQKVKTSRGFNEGGATVFSTETGEFTTLSNAAFTRDAVPGSGYRYSVDPSFGTISVGATTASLVAAVTDRQIEVLGYTVLAEASTAITWKSATTAISGPMTFDANGGASVNGNDGGAVFRTTAGEALQITNASGNIQGHFTYRIV